jgi:hypothetical protein
MKRSQTNEPPTNQPIKLYRVGSSSPTSPPDSWKKCNSGEFKYIPEDIILYIANYFDHFDIRKSEQVCRRLFAIIRSKWPLPPIPCFAAFRSDAVIEDSQMRYLYNSYINFYNNRANDNPNMDPVYYFDDMIDLYSLDKMNVDPSLWTHMRLKSEDDNSTINETLANYLRQCKRLVYLRVDNASNILLNLRDHINLEGLFVEFKSVDGLGAYITSPSSMKAVILYATEKNYQKHHTQLLEPRVLKLHLITLESTELELW